MGLFDDIFGSQRKEAGFQPIPLKPEQERALKMLSELFERGITERFEPRKIAPLTTTEQLAQRIAEDVMRRGIPELTEATGYARGFATTPYDVTQLPEVRGIISDIQEQGRLETGRIGRSLGLRGSLTSSKGRDILGRSVTGTSQKIAAAMSPFLRDVRGQRITGAGMLADLGTRRTTLPLDIAATTGALPRQITQSGLDALFEAITRTQEFKYGPPAGIASNILGQQFYAYDPGYTQPSIFSQIASAIPFSGGLNINLSGGQLSYPKAGAATRYPGGGTSYGSPAQFAYGGW